MVKPKLKPEFERPPRIPLHVRKQQIAREAPRAMADYIKARDDLLERMIELRAARLKQVAG